MDIQTSLYEHAKEKFDWTNYNQSQTKEKLVFMKLLRELCNLVENPRNRQSDPKAIPMSDAIFALGLRTYCNAPIRRFNSDLKLAKESGYIKRDYHFNTMKDHLHHPLTKNILKDLIEVSALPLKSVEKFFAADATGFSTSKFHRWFDARTQISARKRVWRKCHAICGVLTNVVTSVEVTSGEVNDTTQFSKLVQNTASNFEIVEVAADKGYSSRNNLELVNLLGGTPYIPFRSNASGRSLGSPVWKKMYGEFINKQEQFLDHYHKRSNIESVWSMIKARFGNHLRAKKEHAQDNEILLKVLCHNLCVLIQEMFMRGIEPNFLGCAENRREQVKT